MNVDPDEIAARFVPSNQPQIVPPDGEMHYIYAGGQRVGLADEIRSYGEQCRRAGAEATREAAAQYAKTCVGSELADGIRCLSLPSAATHSSVGDLDAALRAYLDEEISIGKMREIIRDWQAGKPYKLPGEAA